MKVVIDGYEVEIKAKSEYSERYNKADTMAVLNTLAIYAGEAACRYSEIGFMALKKRAMKTQDSIVDVLEKAEYYKDCEE